MANLLTRGISYVFHPILIPLYILMALFHQDLFFSLLIPAKSKLILTCVVGVTTIVLPLFSVWIFYRLKVVTSLNMNAREERIYPLLVIAIFYYMTYYLLKSFPISFIFSYYMLGSTFLVICALITSFWMKISLHMIGVGGFLGVFLGLSIKLSMNITELILPAILLAGIVGSARLNENSHKPTEIYSGFLAGVCVMVCLFLMI
jgi:hypothetical protein